MKQVLYTWFSQFPIEQPNFARKFLGEFTVEDAHSEGFGGLGEFKNYWETNIGLWDPTQFLWIHEFETCAKK